MVRTTTTSSPAPARPHRQAYRHQTDCSARPAGPTPACTEKPAHQPVVVLLGGKGQAAHQHRPLRPPAVFIQGAGGGFGIVLRPGHGVGTALHRPRPGPARFRYRPSCKRYSSVSWLEALRTARCVPPRRRSSIIRPFCSRVLTHAGLDQPRQILLLGQRPVPAAGSHNRLPAGPHETAGSAGWCSRPSGPACPERSSATVFILLLQPVPHPGQGLPACPPGPSFLAQPLHMDVHGAGPPPQNS